MPFPDNVSGATLTAEELAELLEVDKRTIYRHAAEEGLPRRRRGEYPLVECVQWYTRRFKAQAELRQSRAGGEGDTAEDEKRRLVVAQTEKVELENRATRNELIDAELVGQSLLEIASIVATQIDAIGPRVAGKVASMTDAGEITLLIRDECAAIRSAIAGAVEAFAAHTGGGAHDQTAAEEDGGRVGRYAQNDAAGFAGAGEVAI